MHNRQRMENLTPLYIYVFIYISSYIWAQIFHSLPIMHYYYILYNIQHYIMHYLYFCGKWNFPQYYILKYYILFILYRKFGPHLRVYMCVYGGHMVCVYVTMHYYYILFILLYIIFIQLNHLQNTQILSVIYIIYSIYILDT